MNKKTITTITFLLISFCSMTFAELRMPTFFSDNMVLQQNSINAIWGWSNANDSISLKTSWGEQEFVEADDEGKWKAFVNTPEYRTGQNITVSSSKESITVNNIAIGEVWLCLGQSNMGWALGNCFNWNEESKFTDNKQLRIYKSDRQHWWKQKNDCITGSWNVSNEISAAQTSAVSWYFGNKLQKSLGIPVGIIVQAYAGTPIEGWLPWEAQNDIDRSIKHKNALETTNNRQISKQGLTFEKAINKYKEEMMLYEKSMAIGDSMISRNKKKKYPIITKPAKLGHQYPSNIYNAMVHPLLGYGIKGIIWYQGERNSKTVQQAFAYKQQLKRLISFYRDIWFEHSQGATDKKLYFSFTQLPSWCQDQEKPVEGIEAPWAVSRSVMLELVKEIDNTGMVVSIDTGDPVELHPKNKKPIGLRHAYNVLHDVYGENKVGHGPYYLSHKIIKDKIEVTFNGYGTGLTSLGKELNSFAIAGADQVWKWATATVKGNRLFVFSKDVKYPVAVRYAWSMNPSKRNLLYNKEGFPASPFRTDDWDFFKDGADEIMVQKPAKNKGYVPKDWERPVMKP